MKPRTRIGPMSLVVLILGMPFVARTTAVTTTYEFLPDQSTVVQTGGFGGTYESYVIEGQFQLTVDFDAGNASFDQVNATYGDGWSLDDLFNMTELVGTVVGDTAINFEGQYTQHNIDIDIFIELAFIDDSAHLTGGFVEPWVDGFRFDLDAVAVPEPATILLLGFGGLILRS